MFEGR